MSNQLSNSIVLPFRSASKPYQYLLVGAVVGCVVEGILDWLYMNSNEAFRPSDYVHFGLMATFLIAILVLKKWSKGLPADIIKNNQILSSYSILCILALPVMIKLTLKVWNYIESAL